MPEIRSMDEGKYGGLCITSARDVCSVLNLFKGINAEKKNVDPSTGGADCCTKQLKAKREKKAAKSKAGKKKKKPDSF